MCELKVILLEYAYYGNFIPNLDFLLIFIWQAFFYPATEMEYVWGVKIIFLEQNKNFLPLIDKLKYGGLKKVYKK